MSGADLLRDTAVQKLSSAPGWYTALLPDDWSFVTPSGGILMTVALRAMQAELGDPELHPTSANTLFCSPVPAGPLEIRVEVLRKGGAAAQVRAALSSTSLPGPGLEVSATFVREREGPDFIDTAPPDVPSPKDAREIHERWDVAFFRNFEQRLAFGAPWWEDGWTPTEARFGRWMRYLVPPKTPDGRTDPFAIPPIADLMPAAVVEKLGPSHQARYAAPSLDLTVHFLDHTTSDWFLTSVHAPRARAGCATANVEVWDDQGRLVARATQMMMLRKRKPRT